jgi:hypothetical protein
MTMQSVFSHTLAFMRKQGRPSMTEGGMCRYNLERAGDVSGLPLGHCAVGCNAPTLLYEENVNYDGQPPDVKDALANLIPDCNDPDMFWTKLQGCHDDPANFLEGVEGFEGLWLADFERYMGKFAERFALEFK